MWLVHKYFAYLMARMMRKMPGMIFSVIFSLFHPSPVAETIVLHSIHNNSVEFSPVQLLILLSNPEGGLLIALDIHVYT